jgi:hypothetical protein
MVNEVQQFKDGGTLISFLYPGQNKDLVDQFIAKKLTAFGKSVSGSISVFNKVNIYRASTQEWYGHVLLQLLSAEL